MDELSKNPIGKKVIDALTKANFDFNKIKPEQLIPTLQKYSGDMLQQNPNILPGFKSELENLMKIKLPEIKAVAGIGTPEGGTETLQEIPGAGQNF